MEPLAPPARWKRPEPLGFGDDAIEPECEAWMWPENPVWIVACKNSHVFHKLCLKTWLAEGIAEGTAKGCPDCREVVSAGIITSLGLRPRSNPFGTFMSDQQNRPTLPDGRRGRRFRLTGAGGAILPDGVPNGSFNYP